MSTEQEVARVETADLSDWVKSPHRLAVDNCLAPIWNEGGTVNRQRRETGWSDRIERGGDSLVCFKAVEYRHVPLTGREACIYDKAYARGAAEQRLGLDRP